MEDETKNLQIEFLEAFRDGDLNKATQLRETMAYYGISAPIILLFEIHPDGGYLLYPTPGISKHRAKNRLYYKNDKVKDQYISGVRQRNPRRQIVEICFKDDERGGTDGV